MSAQDRMEALRERFAEIDLSSPGMGTSMLDRAFGCSRSHAKNEREFLFANKVYHWHRDNSGTLFTVPGRIRK